PPVIVRNRQHDRCSPELRLEQLRVRRRVTSEAEHPCRKLGRDERCGGCLVGELRVIEIDVREACEVCSTRESEYRPNSLASSGAPHEPAPDCPADGADEPRWPTHQPVNDVACVYPSRLRQDLNRRRIERPP